MIQGTVLMRRKTRKELVSTRYWRTDVTPKMLDRCLSKFETSRTKNKEGGVLSVQVGSVECFVYECAAQYVLVFITDGHEKQADVVARVEGAVAAIERYLKNKDLKALKASYSRILSQYAYSHLRIAIIGEAGVGKTSTLYLLKGLLPPSDYRPTIALNAEVIETVHFGNYRLMICDFAGQERSRKFWDLSDAHLIVLLTDSTMKGVIASKEILSTIYRDLPETPIIVIANKQDLPNALDASIISKLMGRETYPLVAVDLAFRDELLMTILNAAARRLEIVIPDLPKREILSLIDDERTLDTPIGLSEET